MTLKAMIHDVGSEQVWAIDKEFIALPRHCVNVPFNGWSRG